MRTDSLVSQRRCAETRAGTLHNQALLADGCIAAGVEGGPGDEVGADGVACRGIVGDRGNTAVIHRGGDAKRYAADGIRAGRRADGDIPRASNSVWLDVVDGD